MANNKSWGENLQEELEVDAEYLTEVLVLRVNRVIRRRMREKGITQTDLASRLGVSQPYVSKLLNYNANLTLRSLALLAQALDAEWAEVQLVPRTVEDETEGEPSMVCVSFGARSKVSRDKGESSSYKSESAEKEYTINADDLAAAA